MVTYSEKTHKIVTDKTFILEPEIKVQTRSLNSPEQLKNCEWGLILNEHGKYCRAHCSSESLNSELCAVRDEQRVHPQRDRKSPPPLNEDHFLSGFPWRLAIDVTRRRKSIHSHCASRNWEAVKRLPSSLFLTVLLQLNVLESYALTQCLSQRKEDGRLERNAS